MEDTNKILRVCWWGFGCAVEVEAQDGRQLWGFIDECGEYVIEPKYEYIALCSRDYVYVYEESEMLDEDGSKLFLQGVANLAGEVVVPIIYKELISNKDGKSIQAQLVDGRWGVIDLNNNVILPFRLCPYIEYDYPVSLHLVKDGSGKNGVVNSDGEVIVPFVYDSLTPAWRNQNCSSESVAQYYVATLGDKCFFVDNVGERVFL